MKREPSKPLSARDFKQMLIDICKLRQSQTSELKEDTAYIVHYGDWGNYVGSIRHFEDFEERFPTEDEACRYASELYAERKQRIESKGPGSSYDVDMLGSIWVERKTVISQTIGFLDLPITR